MLINTNAIVSMKEANQNFSQVARLVDQNGAVVIFKNNRPKYLVIDFSEADTMQKAATENVIELSRKIISENREAYEELAK